MRSPDAFYAINERSNIELQSLSYLITTIKEYRETNWNGNLSKINYMCIQLSEMFNNFGNMNIVNLRVTYQYFEQQHS